MFTGRAHAPRITPPEVLLYNTATVWMSAMNTTAIVFAVCIKFLLWQKVLHLKESCPDPRDFDGYDIMDINFPSKDYRPA